MATLARCVDEAVFALSSNTMRMMPGNCVAAKQGVVIAGVDFGYTGKVCG